MVPIDSLIDLFSTIFDLFNVDKDAEITMEANPGTIDASCLTALRETGVNRLSSGVQSFNDAELTMLGRIHNSQEAKEAIKLIRDAGFNNLNIDLMYGLPNQSISDWENSLEQAAALRPEHLSLYALTLEPDIPLQKAIDDGSLPGIDPDLSADQYELAEAILEKKGYRHYEISNWALPGRECRHNLTYWHNLPYLGIGAAAHSYINGKRFANTSSLDDYLTGFTSETRPEYDIEETIDKELELAETVILGLRLDEGINANKLQDRFGVNIKDRYYQQIVDMTAAGLLEQHNGNISLTARGRLLSNEVFWRFLPEKKNC